MVKAFQYINVVKTFPEFKLGPLNLDLDPGTVIGFVGPNGSGKTTTIHCLTGIYKADSGHMEIFGRPNDPHDSEWKYDIGHVGDVQPFYERWTGAQNLEFLSQFYPNWSNQLVEELAKRLQVSLDMKVKALSRGNRVKLALIAALAHSPKLLLLDEPTSGLDPVVRTEALDALFEAVETGERAIFYATHIISDISRIADELVFIDNGQIILRIPKDDLLEKWRKISFKLPRNDVEFEAAVSHKHEANEHQIISSDFHITLQQLRELGAENIQENRMTMDEIVVQIIKGSNDVATS